MDPAIGAAGRALRAGDPLGALKRVALRDDPAALALRGIAMAQLGELRRARELLRSATRAFGPRRTAERARCLAAEAEVALAARDLAWPSRVLPEALRIFAAHGDRENAAHAQLLETRRLLLLGRVGEAEAALAALELGGAPARVFSVAAMVAFELALRRGRAGAAQEALSAAREAALRSGIGALRAEVEEVLASADLVVDGCGRAARRGPRLVRLSRRPVLFALLRELAAVWPGEAPRDILVERAFGARRTNPSYRVRPRVEIGRLRRELRPLAGIRATRGGFALAPNAGAVRLLAPPVESPGAAVLALLADGEAWSTSALSLALGSSPRTAQRTLAALEEAGQVRGLGRGRSRRWLSAPIAGFATTLLPPGTEAFG